eukprot:4010407-Prymnesium_polylepis.1
MINAMQLSAVVDNEPAEVVADLAALPRGAVEELIDGIDPDTRSSIAIPSRHHDCTAYTGLHIMDVRSANAHAYCTSVCGFVTAMLSSPTYGV